MTPSASISGGRSGLLCVWDELQVRDIPLRCAPFWKPRVVERFGPWLEIIARA
jgi:hypothetical protein